MARAWHVYRCVQLDLSIDPSKREAFEQLTGQIVESLQEQAPAAE